ncbi:intercellular adhesion molecule 3-like [Python bivittatus]|uniref:Intercellular adhesion molecule 3-like n=1 Tax=Python bivittatus TaxID=176946 RepID=A0A9F2WFR3_PYTBI|nr:intercellular adhesion molecule 3-like [Python bivittatus]
MTTVLLLIMPVLLFWVPTMHPCEVTINPKVNNVMFGASLNLTCMVSCSSYNKLRWEVALPSVTKKGDGWIDLYVANVTEWTLPLLCLVNYGVSNQTYARTEIFVYQFSTPAIYPVSEVVSDHLDKIVCNISSLKVSGSVPSNINISLSRGGSILNSSNGEPSVEYNFMANLEQDDGAEILCEANLLVGSQELRKNATRILKVVAKPYNVNISATHVTYKVDANIVVTCDAKGKPHPEFSWDLPPKADVEFSNGNKTVTIRSAKEFHNGTYRCLAHNVYGKNSAQIDIVFEGKSRIWVIVPVMTVLVLGLIIIVGVWYFCRK